MRRHRKKETAPCSENGAVAVSFKLNQNYYLTQFILQTPAEVLNIPPTTLKSKMKKLGILKKNIF